MERIEPEQIVDALLNSAGWARVGLTAPDERMRIQAAKELAATVIDVIEPSLQPDPRQLHLFA